MSVPARDVGKKHPRASTIMDDFYEEDMKDAPIGIDDFKRVISDDSYYVDKTEFIADILDSSSTKVFLFTRPRRFGKTLNISMLDAFFNIEYKGNTWFDGLKIEGREDLSVYKNAFPVVRLDLSNLPCRRLDDFQSYFEQVIADLFREHSYLKDWESLDEDDLETFTALRKGTAKAAAVNGSVSFLCGLLKRYHGREPIVLIDEYDSPINNAFGKDTFEDITEFMKLFYTSSLKRNGNMRFAVLTGVMRLAKESIFSGLNNLYVNDILSEEFDERFGFTEEEVKGLLINYERPDKFEECKEWYDGYRFGNSNVYNPWSVNNYARRGFKPGTYWGGTSGNDIISTLVRNADQNVYDELKSLGEGGSVVKSMEASIPMRDLLQRNDTIYTVMAMTGYLNSVPSEKGYEMSIPNREMYEIFYDMVMSNLDTPVRIQFGRLFDALEKGDVAGVEANAFSILAENFSSLQLKDEGDYQLVIAAAAMGRLGKYRITVEGEAGNGKADMIMKRNTPSCPNIVVEFKRSLSDDPEEWLQQAKNGLEQVKRKEYFHGLTGRTLAYGVCFRNKKAAAVMEEMSLRGQLLQVTSTSSVLNLCITAVSETSILTPEEYISLPSQAIMAPLSMQNLRSGTNISAPLSWAMSATISLRRMFWATPPPRRTSSLPMWAMARSVTSVSIA